MRRTLTLSIMLLTLSLAHGCEDASVRTYQAPKDQPPPHLAQTPAQQQPAMPPQAEAGGEVRLTWQLPDGWRERDDPGAMRIATILTGPSDDAVEVAITRFPGSVGGLLANVNRWRGEVGLEPVDEEELVDLLEVFEADGRRIIWADMTGTPASAGAAPRRSVVAMQFDGRFSWFIKMLDTDDRIEPLVPTFQRFVADSRFRGGAPGAPPADTSSPAPTAEAEAGSAIRADSPPGWTRTAPRSMVLAVWTVEGGAEATVSSFPGDVGGTFANVGRWRTQVGAPPIASLGEQPSSAVQVAGQPATRYELRGPEQAMLIAMQQRGNSTWFYKLMGPVETVDAQQRAFDQWLASMAISE